jgi:hypothetical protein
MLGRVSQALMLLLTAPPAAVGLRGLFSVGRPALLAPCGASRCAVLLLDDPDDPSPLNDDEMLAKQQSHFDEANSDVHDECVVTDMGTSCITIEHANGPDPYVPPQVEDERQRRSPGLMNNFYDVSTEDFKKPYVAAPPPAAGARSTGSQSSAAAESVGAGHDDVTPVAKDPAEAPPPVGDVRRARSPGLQNNFYDLPTAEFKQPRRVAEGAVPTGSSSEGGDLQARVEQLEQSNEQLGAALSEAMAREESLMQRLAALKVSAVVPARVPRAAQWPVWSDLRC